MKNSRLRIIVSGMVAQCPVGGVAWDYLQYVIGLSELGHDVYYHEDTWCWPYDPVRNTASPDGSYSAQFLQSFFARHAPALIDRWHYNHLHERSYGMSPQDFSDVAGSAELFLNVSGVCAIPPELNDRCLKVFLDTDPGYNQINLIERFAWSENIDRWCEQVAAHDVHFTYAECMGAEECTVPTAGFSWKTTRMPVVLRCWSHLSGVPARPQDSWTTVMTWNNFRGNLIHQGVEYRGKGPEFEKFIDLPARVNVPLEIAVGGQQVPQARLEAHGWKVTDGPRATLTAESYQQFIRRSRGEISTAKNVYVAMHTGWFSCRSACYLAAGRPAILQDTGFSRQIPCGHGLLAFNTLDEATQMIESVEANYARHAAAATQIARQCFDSNRVLSDLLDATFDSSTHDETA